MAINEIPDDNKAVFGLYKSRVAVEAGVDRLKSEGFASSEISVLMPEGGSAKFAHEKATKAPEGATAGASTGLVVGGALGWLVGIGALAIPGFGPFIAAGPIIALLAGAGSGAAIGGVAGGLIGLGIPEYEAKRYEDMIRNGGILLSVHTGSSEVVKRAKAILHETGAQDIASTSEVTGGPKTANRQTPINETRTY